MTLETELETSRRRRQSDQPITGCFLARTAKDPKKELAEALHCLQEAVPGYAVLYGMRIDGNDFHTCMLPDDEHLSERVKKLFSGPVLKHTYDGKEILRDYYQRS